MRSGYVDEIDDNWALIKYRGQVASAIRGKRGQRLLREALAALDAMPAKVLIADELVTEDGDVCLLGAAGKRLGIADLDKLDPEEHDVLAQRFDVASCLIQEIEYINDEMGPRSEAPQQRYERVRGWLVKHIAAAAPAPGEGTST